MTVFAGLARARRLGYGAFAQPLAPLAFRSRSEFRPRAVSPNTDSPAGRPVPAFTTPSSTPRRRAPLGSGAFAQVAPLGRASRGLAPLLALAIRAPIAMSCAKTNSQGAPRGAGVRA